MGRQQGEDFRSFLFRATGRETEIESVTVTAAIDNLHAEFRRLDAIADAMGHAQREVEAETVRGLSEVIGDGIERARLILSFLNRKENGQGKEEE